METQEQPEVQSRKVWTAPACDLLDLATTAGAHHGGGGHHGHGGWSPHSPCS